MKKTIIILLSLLFTIPIVNAQNTDEQANYDNALKFYNQYRYDSSLIYVKKAVKKTKKQSEQKKLYSQSLILRANIFYAEGNYTQALEDYQKAVVIYKEFLRDENNLFAENSKEVEQLYYSLGKTLEARGELNLALEYYQKTLRQRKIIYNENSVKYAQSLTAIARIYIKQKKVNFAQEKIEKAGKIIAQKTDENPIITAETYSCTANFHQLNQAPEKAQTYKQKALDYYKKQLPENHQTIAKELNEIAAIYYLQGDYFGAIEYAQKAFNSMNGQFKPKHPYLANSYYQIGRAYELKKDLNKALNYYQKSISANLPYFNDSLNVYAKPVLVAYSDPILLLKTLQAKARCLEKRYYKELLEKDIRIALQTVQLSDNLITTIRSSHRSNLDKIDLGQYAADVYERAISVCHVLYKLTKQQQYWRQAFLASEKNKAGTLVGELAEIEAQKYGNIPEEALQEERALRIEIAHYKKLIAKGKDRTPQQTEQLKDQLFAASRLYDELILQFEKKYPDYYKYKYSYHTTKFEELQAMLNRNTAIRSYFVGDTSIYIFTLMHKKYKIELTKKMDYLDTYTEMYRDMIFQLNEMDPIGFQSLSYTFYKQLFPSDLPRKIKQLIIIPDGSLSTIPFETLLNQEPDCNPTDYHQYPFLIKKCKISYTYSANLLYHSLKDAQNPQKELNDWLALAPVFSDESEVEYSAKTRGIISELDNAATISDNGTTRGRLLYGEKIMPLPGTEKEVNAIYKNFTTKERKAEIQTHQNANEAYMKSGYCQNFKYLHIATHGFVNSQNPELSGILLAEDQNSENDGILYSGEIYNLNLNADLVILSACETGLGKLSKGEGVIGLSRALMYAGSKNVIVSLWKVADSSTSELMVDFYDLLTNEEIKNNSFSTCLQNAKLKMITNKKYAHPYYWSPFILIGI